MYFTLKMFGRHTALAAAIACLLPIGASAAPLSEAEALRVGLARPELADLAQARLTDADADALEASTWSNPSLELARDKTGQERETAWQLSQTIDVSGRRGLRRDAATHRRNAADAENQAQRHERAAEIRRAFYDVLRQQEVLRAVETWAARFADIGRVVDKLSRAGEASGYDRRRLVREQRAAEARVSETRADLERSRARLAALLAQPAHDGVSGRLLPDAPADVPALLERVAARPDLHALAARAEAAQAENAAAQRQFPEITVGVGRKRIDDGQLRESGTLLSVSIPLPLFDRQQAGNRRTTAQAMTARAELALARQKAEGELQGLHRQLSQLIDAASRYRLDAVEPSADLIRIAEVAYRAGESTILELLDAYKGALEAHTTVMELEWKAREARIELDQLTGNYPQ